MLGLAENNFKTCGVPHSMLRKILPKRIKYRNIIPRNEALMLGVGFGVLDQQQDFEIQKKEQI